MKILLVHEHYRRPGGEDQVFADEGWLLESRGHGVVRHTRHNDALDGTDRLRAAADTVWNRRACAELAAVIDRERPDVLHAHNTFPILSPAIHRTAAARGVATVQTLHNFRLICPQAQLLRDGRVCEDCVGKPFAWPGVLHACYRGSRAATAATAAMSATHRTLGTWGDSVDRFIALTEHGRGLFVRGGLPADRIAVKPNFVHPDPRDRPPVAGDAGGRPSVIFVGRLSPEKGLDVLLSAWPRVTADARLTVVGDGPLAPAVEAAAAADPRVEQPGQIPFEAVLDRIAAADLLVMPSVWYETFGRTVVEAFAAGTPVVASRLGAMAELIEDGVTGTLFPPGDAAALASAVDALLADGARRRRLSAAARRTFEDRYTADRNYDLLTDIYDRAMSRAAARRGTRPAAAPEHA